MSVIRRARRAKGRQAWHIYPVGTKPEAANWPDEVYAAWNERDDAREQLQGAVAALRAVVRAAAGVTQVRNGAEAERWHRALAGAEAMLDANGGGAVGP